MSALEVVPEQLSPGSAIFCRRLQCTLSARVCALRQSASELQRTKDTWRGESSAYPSCVTSRCAQGREVRAAVEANGPIRWKGVGPGGRFCRDRHNLRAQHQARQRLIRTGALGAVPTIDREPFGDERPPFAGGTALAIPTAAEASRLLAGGADP